MRLFRSFPFLSVILALSACTIFPAPSDVVFLEEGSSGSASVEVNYQSESKVELVFPSSGGTANVAIRATGAWTAVISQGASVDWCSFTPSDGTKADGFIHVSVSANENYNERNCTVVLNEGENRRTLVVTQNQKDALLLIPSKVEVPASGGTVEIEVSHTAKFSYAISKSATEWILPAGTRGLVTEKVRFTVPENTDTEPREGDIAFSSPVGNGTVHVYQEGLAPCLILTPKDFQFGHEGGTFEVEIKSNLQYGYTIAEGSSWIKGVSTRIPLSTHIVTFSVAASQEDFSRTGKIVFSDSAGELSETVTVTQAGTAVFILDPGAVTLEQEGGSFVVRVTSTHGYKLSSAPDWITEKSKEAVEGQPITWQHTFTVSENPMDGARTGVAVFCNDLGVCVPVSVTQYGRKDFTWKRPFYHQSLLQRFTATWCQYCPDMETLVQAVQKQYSGKLQEVAIHGPSSDLQFSAIGPLVDLFKVNAYPSLFVDGRVKVNSSSAVIQASKETESTYGTATGIGIRSVLSSQHLTMDVSVYCRKAGNYKLVVLLVENGIVGYQKYVSGDIPDYVHNSIARKAVTNVLGDSFTAPSDLYIKSFSFDVEIPASYKAENMRILAYVLCPDSSQYGSHVDNCAAVKAGSSLEVQLQ